MPASVTKLAFGSCNKQKLEQSHWDVIARDNKPDLFFWTGDAVYGKCNTLDCMTDALWNLTKDERYRSFTQSSEIEGVWDDHDFGVNDGKKILFT